LTTVFLLDVVAAVLLVGASALIFRELLIADGPLKATRRRHTAHRPADPEVRPLRRAA